MRKTRRDGLTQFNEAKQNRTDITILGDYTKWADPVLVRCNTCGKEWHPRASSICQGTGCKDCHFKLHRRGKNTKHTTTTFVSKVKEIHGDAIQVLGEYQAVKKPVLLQCTQCQHEWNARADVTLRGGGCPICNAKVRGRNKSLGVKKTLFDTVAARTDIEIIGDYTGMRKKILVRCTQCKKEWEMLASHLKEGDGCQSCFFSDRRHVHNQKDTEAYRKDLLSQEKEVEPIGEYVHCNTPLLHRCLTCGYEFEKTPSSVLKSVHGCFECAKKEMSRLKLHTHEDYVRKFNARWFGRYQILGTYEGWDTDLRHSCEKHGEYEAKPRNTLKGGGASCPKCGGIYLYKLGDRIVRLRGYEPQALNYLLKKLNIPPSWIRVDMEDRREIPTINYTSLSGTKHKHHPDIMVLREGHPPTIIEVKGRFSLYEMEGELERNQLKARSAIQSGMDYRMMCLAREGPLIPLPENWVEYTAEQLHAKIGRTGEPLKTSNAFRW